MVEKERLKKEFSFLENKVLAILLFGSSVTGEGRDVDICIVSPKGLEISEIFRNIDASKYDIWLFEELPLYMKIEVIESHEIIYCKDEPELYEYFYRFRRIWKDQERRNRLSKEDMLRMLSKE